MTVSNVWERVKLPCSIDYQTALKVTNKVYLERVFEENQISTAKHTIMGQLDGTKIANMKYPLIVQPVDCNSSKVVKRVNDLEELKTAFDVAVNLSRTKTTIVEEFIEGA